MTGTHGSMRHMGNVTVSEPRGERLLDRERGANLLGVGHLFDTTAYLTPHSDLVALMVLEHQTALHNLFTFAQMDTRRAAHYDDIMNKALERPADYQSESSVRRFHAATEKIVQGLLYRDEFRLESPVAGTSNFTREFAQRGPHDSHGRSIREFDLQTRLFKYPCSYLIYSDAFQKLPEPVLTQVLNRLKQILTAETAEPNYTHLTHTDRTAIYEILRETLPQWQPARN